MQNASKVANGYKTILSNLMTKDLEDQFNEFGLTMRDQNGEMKDAFTILEELAGAYNNIGTTIDETTGETVSLNDSMNQLLDDIAGAHNINVLTSGFDNFEQAINATESAMNSAGSASNEYAIALDTVKMKGEALLGQFQELVVGDGGLTSFIKLLLDAGTSILKFANSDVGKVIIKTTLLITSLNLLNKGFTLLSKTGVGNLVKDFIALNSGAQTVVASTTAMKIATDGLTATLLSSAKAWATSPLGMGTIAVASILAIKEAIEYVYEAFDRNVEKLNELNSAYESQNQTVDSTEKSLEEVRSKIEEINNLNGLDITDEQELQNLKLEEAVLENQLRIEQEKLEVQRQQLEAQAQKTLTSQTVIGGQNIGGSSVGATYQVETATPTEALAKYTEEIQKSQSAIDSYLQEKQKLIDSGVEEGDEIDSLNNKIADEIEIRDEARENASDYADIINDAIKNLDEESDLYKDVQDVLDDYLDTTDDVKDSLEDTGDEADDTASKMYDLGNYSSEAMTSMNEATKEQQDEIASLASQIDNITSAYQTAVNALYEYNQQGYLSVDTYSQLMQLAPQYLAMMINENGQLYANADAVTTAYQAKVYLMGVEAAEAQVSLAATMAAKNGAGAYANLGSQAISTAGSLWELVKAEMAAEIAKVKDPRDLEALENRINAINDLTQSTIANAKYTTASIKPTNASTGATKRNTGANKGNTGARKKNADAIKAQTNALKKQKEALEEEADALEKEIEDYETVIDYVKDLLKEEQEALEEQKDKELEAIQDKIDALEEEQEAMEDNVDAQIDALEKQKDEQEEYWDAQIEAIENANDALETNMELQRLQEALAKAKSQKVKVLKGGRFVYAEDEEAISKAEQELADYEMQLSVQRQIEELERLKEEALDSLEKQIEELENYRDEANKNYEQQLKDLQDHYDKVEEEYDKRIEQYNDWLEQFEDMLEASSKRHAQILYNELVGEQGNWDARIKALGTFVKNYEKKKNELDGIKDKIEAIDDRIKSLQNSAKTSYNSAKNYATLANNAANAAAAGVSKAKKAVDDYYLMGTYSRTGRRYAVSEGNYSKVMNDYYKYANQTYTSDGKKYSTYSNLQIEKHALGIYETPEDEIALVADPIKPSNRELVVGSKINKGEGVLSSLKKGYGVIPSGQNFTEQLVNLARWSSNGGFERTFTTMNQSSSKTIHIENINLPNVSNGEEFVRYLEDNFVNDSLQFANIRE